MRPLYSFKSNAELAGLTHSELIDYVAYVHNQMAEAYAEHCKEIKDKDKELAELKERIAAVKLVLRD